jgi:hypothetical protein
MGDPKTTNTGRITILSSLQNKGKHEADLGWLPLLFFALKYVHV